LGAVVSGTERLKIGEVGVDSGTLLIGDPCYCFDGDDLDAAFSVIGAGLHGEAVLPRGIGVISSTGYGDGVYPVYVETVADNWGPGRRVARIIVECIPDA
jgi:hypothetical protein